MSIYLDGSLGPEGRALILIHGAGGSHALWRQVRQRLVEARIPAVALDLPGHGRSPGPALDSVERCAEVAEQALGQAGVGEYVAVGHSLGGAVVLTLAVRGAKGLRGVGAVCTGARLAVDGRLLQGILKSLGPTVKKIIRYCFARGASEELRREAEELMVATGAPGVHADFAACTAYGLSGELLRSIALPVEVVCGEEDVMTPPDLSRELVEEIPGARLSLIPACGHMPLLEQPEALAGALAALWERAFHEG